MHIADGIEMLELSATVLGRVDNIYPTLFWDQEMAILVDTGYPGMLAKIQEEMEKAGVPFEHLRHIILTHQDLDHIGSLPNLVSESVSNVQVYSNEVEKPYIQGDKQLLKLTPDAIAQIDSIIPPDVPVEWRNAFKAVLENPPRAQVHRTLADGDVLPYCAGITIINTPGHTPGHISLYHISSKTLIAGDAMIVADGQLQGPDPQQTLDRETAQQSLKKLTQYDIQTVICYHGGFYNDNVNLRIAELANACV